MCVGWGREAEEVWQDAELQLGRIRKVVGATMPVTPRPGLRLFSFLDLATA